MYATTPEGQRHHIHLMDSPAMSSLLLHPHIAPSAGTLTPTPLATLPGGVCADPKLLCASGAAPAAVSASTSASSGQLPPAASAFAYQHQGTGGSAGGGYFPHAAASFYATQSMSASSSVASALSMAALDPTIMSGASSRFTSPAGAFRALSAPPMVESRVGSPIREIVEDQAQHELDSEMEQGQGDCMRAPATGPTTRRMTRRARRQEDELEDDDMEVDTPSEFHVTVKLEPDADPMDEDNGSHVDAKPTQTPAKRPVGRPRKTRGRPRRVVAEQEPEQGPETEPGVEVEVPAARSKRTKRAGAAKAKDGGLLSGLGDALLLTAAAAAKSAAASEGSVRQASDAEDHEPQEDAGMGQLHSPQPQPPAPPAPAPAAPKSKPSSKKRSRASTAPNPPTAASAARSIPDNHPTSHVAYPKASLVVGQIDLFPHPLDARVTDLRRHFKSRNSFGSGALELALSATAPNIPSPLSISMSAVAGGDDDNDQHHQDDGKPKTTAEAKALGMSKDAIRQLRNKISARNFRQRKKQYIHTLEDQVLDLKRQLAEEVKARVEVEAKLNQCERQLGVQETPTRGEWPVGWREEVGRIGMVEGEDGEDDVEDGDDDEAVGDEAAGASKKKRQRVSSAPPAGKKFPGAVAAEGATGESTGKRKGTRKSSAAQPQNASTSAAAEAEHEDSEPPVELEHTAMSRQSSTQPNQAPAAVPAANYYPHAGTAPTAMVAMPPGIYSPLQQQHLTATHAAAVAPGAYPASSSAASGTGAASGYSAQHHPFMAYQQHMHSASAQAAISHARRAAAAAVSAAMGGGPGGHQTNTHGMYQHGQGPHYHVGAARR
ncbi:hypothetical protein BCR44DRAFT_1438668 [Catenaria anguillulae PL171]|uniref:BZIP domain-containing protein n=1 Tax=Catenaria anguillulae PL171 TaxID=765915 RepID=A0A1Y2HJL1_9FUNG|nr:hypothetical protein BCR44DRAFT_1438668 [Catenaria anguillulae PL171]